MTDYSKITALYSRLLWATRTGTAAEQQHKPKNIFGAMPEGST